MCVLATYAPSSFEWSQKLCGLLRLHLLISSGIRPKAKTQLQGSRGKEWENCVCVCVEWGEEEIQTELRSTNWSHRIKRRTVAASALQAIYPSPRSLILFMMLSLPVRHFNLIPLRAAYKQKYPNMAYAFQWHAWLWVRMRMKTREGKEELKID